MWLNASLCITVVHVTGICVFITIKVLTTMLDVLPGHSLFGSS